MIKVFVIDSTEKSLYYSVLVKHVAADHVDVEASVDRALAKLGAKPYQLILVSRGTGKSNLFDFVDSIKQSRINKGADIIIVEDNPTVSTKLAGILKGRRVYRFKSNQLTELDDLVERMSS